MQPTDFQALFDIGWKVALIFITIGAIYAEIKSFKLLLKTEIESVKETIKDLKEEQKKYNNLQERVSKSEKISEINSIRIDNIEERLR